LLDKLSLTWIDFTFDPGEYLIHGHTDLTLSFTVILDLSQAPPSAPPLQPRRSLTGKATTAENQKANP
jgi:hypothetical protein